MKLKFHFVAVHLSFLLLADAKSLRTLPTTSDSDESRNLEDTPCFKKVAQYGTYPVTLQNDVEGRIGKVNYLAESVDPATTTVYTYENPDEWVLLSQLPNGWTDPKYGECVKFGDKVVISNAKVGKLEMISLGHASFRSMNMHAIILFTIFLPFFLQSSTRWKEYFNCRFL